MMFKNKILKKERGVALLIVTLMVVLLSMLVMQVSHSTFLYSRSIGRMERNVQSEYLLKSIVNIGASMLENDATPNYDSVEDPWGLFLRGAPIPEDYLAQVGINYPGIEVMLEVVPENSKINIADNELREGGNGSVGDSISDAEYTTKELFVQLGFNEGPLFDTSDQNVLNRRFNSMELTSNLIDFYDNNSDNFSTANSMPDGEILPDGVESSLPENYFPKEGRKVGNFEINELLMVPGMTPMRLRTLLPFAKVEGKTDINVNFASREVLVASHPEIDDTAANSIIDYRNDNVSIKETNELKDVVSLTKNGRLVTRTRFFELIGMVRFGDTKAHYIRSRIDRQNPSTPIEIMNVTMY